MEAPSSSLQRQELCNSSRHSGLLFDVLRVELVSFISQLEHKLFAEPAWFRTLQVDSWLDWCEMELSSPPPQPEQASGMDRSSFGEASMRTSLCMVRQALETLEKHLDQRALNPDMESRPKAGHVELLQKLPHACSCMSVAI